MIQRTLLLSITIFFLAACASLSESGTGGIGRAKSQPAGSAGATTDDGAGMSWWSIRFFPAWPTDSPPNWHVDALLADKVFKGILSNYGDEISVWRFHRRALQDETGHRFSFLFYCEPSVAAQVYEAVDTHPVTRQLLASGVIRQQLETPLQSGNGASIADTSDPSWSKPMRESWPYFAMGVSQSWLALVSNVASANSPPNSTAVIEETLDYYRIVNDQVTRHWRLEGGHAYLHHLNALFGYEDIAVKGERTMRF